MLVKYVNIEDKIISTFAYVICEEDGVIYTPVYNKMNKITRFVEVTITNTLKVDVDCDYDLQVGDTRLYAYYRHGAVYFGKEKKIKSILLELLNDGKPWKEFCKLDVIEFLGLKGEVLDNAIRDCYLYLRSVSPNYAIKWAESMKYNITGNQAKEAIS